MKKKWIKITVLTVIAVFVILIGLMVFDAYTVLKPKVFEGKATHQIIYEIKKDTTKKDTTK